MDGKVGTTPLFTIVGAMVGAAAGFYSIVHQLMGALRKKAPGAGRPGDKR